MAYEFAKKLKISYPDSWDKAKITGKDWYYSFMQRQSNISLRTPENISMARAKAFNRISVNDFFSNYTAVLEKTEFPRSRRWNMDETGFPTVPTKVQKILSEKGSKRVSQMSSAEQGTNVTVAVAVNAAGTIMAPFFLFPKLNMQARFMDNVSSDCVGYANGSGWMQQAEFTKFMIHFIHHANCHKDSPTPAGAIQILLDNHVSHMSVSALDLAVEHGVTILSFPPHCSHRMQPLDCGMFSPIKAHYVSKYSTWMKNNAGKVFELHHVPHMVEQCLDEGVTPKIIKKAFERTGIYKFDPDVFTDNDFIVAEMCNKVLDEIEGDEVEGERVIAVLEPSTPAAKTPCLQSLSNSVGPVQPGQIRKKSKRGPKPKKSAI